MVYTFVAFFKKFEIPTMSQFALVSFFYFCIKKKCRKSRDVPTRGRDVFRPVTLQVQEDFKVETGRIWLHFITEDKFMPVSHNLWSVSVSSHWLRDILVLFICHAVTLNKILFLLFFICFTGYLHLQQRRELFRLTVCLSTEDI